MRNDELSNFHSNQVFKNWIFSKYTPRGIRIPVFSVKGRCPGPLDDGGVYSFPFWLFYDIKNFSFFDEQKKGYLWRTLLEKSRMDWFFICFWKKKQWHSDHTYRVLKKCNDFEYFKFLEAIFVNFNIFYITPLKKNVNIFEVFFLKFSKKIKQPIFLYCKNYKKSSISFFYKWQKNFLKLIHSFLRTKHILWKKYGENYSLPFLVLEKTKMIVRKIDALVRVH